MTDPHWTQVLAALLTPTIAVFGLLIAYLQWCTAEKKRRFDFFEKRFAVYDIARDFIESVLINGKAKNEEMSKFLFGTREAKWLLNEDIATYFDKQIWKKAVDLQTLDNELERVPVGDVRANNDQRQNEIMKWFIDQQKVLDEKFSPFLKLESLKVRRLVWWRL